MSEAPTPAITVRIRLDRPGEGKLNVLLGFRNDGTAPALVWERLAMKDGKLDARRFIVSADGAPAAYLGPTTVRREQTEADFHTLAPGEIVTSTIQIGQYYALPSRGRVSVTFAAFNPGVLEQRLLPLRSNTATIDLT